MTILTYAHLADIHLGSFRDKKMRSLQVEQFNKAIETILDVKYDFVLISGDIFNVANPPLEYVELVISKLKELHRANIPVFVIGGSHDYSLTHKSFIQLLDSAGIWRDVGNWRSVDGKTIELIPTTIQVKGIEVSICGVLGRKNGLDSKLYTKISNSITPNSQTQKYSIFMFHSTITELLPSRLQKSPIQAYSKTILPQGFNYYAGGHIHYPNSIPVGNDGLAAYSGPIFPNSFTEFKDGFSGFNEITYNSQTQTQTLTYIPLPMRTITPLIVDCEHLHHGDIDVLIEKTIQGTFTKDSLLIQDAIILFELFGTILSSTSAIQISKHISTLYELGAYCVLKNTQKLHSKKFEQQTQKHKFSTVQELEEKVTSNYLKEKISQETQLENKTFDEKIKQNIISSILSLDTKKNEEETNYHFEERIISMMKKTIQEELKN